MIKKRGYWFLCLLITFGSCLPTTPPKEEARLRASLDPVDTVGSETKGVKAVNGEELPGLRFSKSQMQLLESRSLQLEKLYIKHPDSLDILMKYARSLDDKGAYLAASNVYRHGVSKFPRSAPVYQYKGFNQIVTRDFRAAVRDLQTAVFYNRELSAALDPYRNVDLMESTNHFYSWYYLGLAYYFNRNFDSAISSFKKCLALSDKDDDLIVIPYFWLYIIYQEIGNPESAIALLEDVNTNMLIVKSKDYFRGLLLFKGVFKPGRLMRFTVDQENHITQPIQAFALVKWYRFQGEESQADRVSEQLIQSNSWNSLGYIACEVDIHTNSNLN